MRFLKTANDLTVQKNTNDISEPLPRPITVFYLRFSVWHGVPAGQILIPYSASFFMRMNAKSA